MSNQAVYVPADDMTDPAPATTFIHLDATTALWASHSLLGLDPKAQAPTLADQPSPVEGELTWIAQSLH